MPDGGSNKRAFVSKEDDDAMRTRIMRMMVEGLVTEVEPFPKTQKEFNAIVDKLRSLPLDDLEKLLVISGFVHHPVGDQSCANCIYYLPNRKFCDIPELALPVEADWWCRLWRV
jgi:hypothetical protein